jgi:hypothetical protein
MPKFIGWAAAGVVVAGFALLCWDQIRRTLSTPIDVQLALATGGPAAMPLVHGGTATVGRPGIEAIGADITHISSQLQWMIAGDLVLKFALMAAVVLTVGVVWIRTSNGRPFARSVTFSLVILAVLVAVLGSGIEVLESFINNREAYEALGNDPSGDYYATAAGFTYTGLELFIAAGIGVLASAFGIGARLTRDTEGLV